MQISRAFSKHVHGVDDCHRVRQVIFDEHPYLVRQLSVFYRHCVKVVSSFSLGDILHNKDANG
jgi:hypothetical protein